MILVEDSIVRSTTMKVLLGRMRSLGLAREIHVRAANARIVQGDATFLVRSLLPDRCLTAVHVYFPDPWWKARHRKRRVLSEPFLLHVGRVLGDAGVLHVWTDVEEYFLESLAAARATGLFEPHRDEPATEPRHDLDYRTHFERRTRLAGLPVWRAALVRNATPAGCTRVAAPALPAAVQPPKWVR